MILSRCYYLVSQILVLGFIIIGKFPFETIFMQKNMGEAYFYKHLVHTATKHWSKYTTNEKYTEKDKNWWCNDIGVLIENHKFEQ